MPEQNALGVFLKDRRSRLDAAHAGVSMTRRRTPGLRREEVAQRAHVSTTWYTALEQGRGGPPSVEVLERLARALALSEVEREHLFLLAQNRPPQVRYQPDHTITPQLQRVLDAMVFSPAFIKTPEWNLVAWNHAAAVVLTDYGQIPPDRRNLLRLMFSEPEVRQRLPNWAAVARSSVATFRAEVTRNGANAHVHALVEELSASYPEFGLWWQDQQLEQHGQGTKHIQHPAAGALHLDYAAFAVEGQPQLQMVVYTPSTAQDQAVVQGMLAQADVPAPPDTR